jgi:hypothetical protein
MTPEHPTPSGWIDLEITATDPTTGDLGNPPSVSPAPAPRTVSGRTVVIALTVATLALAVAIVGLLIRSRTVTTATHTQAIVQLGVDASGCPVGRTCQVSSNPESAILGAVDRALDFPTVIASVTVSDPPTNVTYRTTLTAVVNPGVIVTTTAQCIPGGSAVPERSNGLAATGPADGAVGVPGEPGCSVVVVVRAPAGAPVPVQAIEHIAHDPSAQLHARR